MVVQTLGWFGLTENEKIADYLFSVTSDPSLKSFWQEGGVNVALVKKLVDNYNLFTSQGMSGETLAANMQIATGTSRPIINAFISYKGGAVALQPSPLDQASSGLRALVSPVTEPINKVLDTMQIILIAASVIGRLPFKSFKRGKYLWQNADYRLNSCATWQRAGPGWLQSALAGVNRNAPGPVLVNRLQFWPFTVR